MAHIAQVNLSESVNQVNRSNVMRIRIHRAFLQETVPFLFSYFLLGCFYSLFIFLFFHFFSVWFGFFSAKAFGNLHRTKEEHRISKQWENQMEKRVKNVGNATICEPNVCVKRKLKKSRCSLNDSNHAFCFFFFISRENMHIIWNVFLFVSFKTERNHFCRHRLNQSSTISEQKFRPFLLLFKIIGL